MPSTTNFSQPGDANRPSPSIWSNCPNTLLNDLGLGTFIKPSVTGGPVTATVTAASPVLAGFSTLADAATVSSFVATRKGGALDLETDGDDNDAYTLHTEELGKISKNSGTKVWFECGMELGDIGMDGGMFFGLVQEVGATLELVTDAAGALITESMMGFRILTATPSSVDIVYAKDAGTPVVVLAAANNSTALTAAGGTAALLVNDTVRKFGLHFDGRETVRFYVDGYKVASLTVDSTVAQDVNMVAAYSLKTGAAAAESSAISFIQVAVQDHSG